MSKVKMGEMVIVENRNPRPNANGEYVALWVENESGEEDTERCLFFRRSFVDKLSEIKFCDGICAEMKLGRLYPFSIGTKEFFAVNVRFLDGSKRIVRMTDKMILNAEQLAERNAEDIPDRGWWNDFKD